MFWRASPMSALDCGISGCHPVGQRFRNNITVSKSGTTCRANYTVGFVNQVDWLLQVAPEGCTGSTCPLISIGSNHGSNSPTTTAVYPVSWACS